MNPYVEGSVVGDGGGSENEKNVSYTTIAARLLQDNFLLTALELHTELVETGRELPQLREFFSNPGNFEQHVSRPGPDVSMQRTPSQATLDSLDLARYSEDGAPGAGGGAGSDVAVLEFELRKARETINALRANLTQFADCESSETISRERLDEGTLKPHEKRALNFLVNEYLLLQAYKLTAITFSDENPHQDFEDWDDVGLNMPRPCGLISLYRGERAGHGVRSEVGTSAEVTHAESQTEGLDETCVSCQTSFHENTDWNHELLVQAEEILLLKRQILALETEKLNFQKLYDAALASLNSLATPVSESPGLDLTIPCEKLMSMKETSLERICEQPLTYAENHYGSNASTSSMTPEQFEMIDCEKNVGSLQKEGSNTSSFEPARAYTDSPRDSPLRRGSVATLDDTLSLNEAGEWTRIHHSDNASGNSDTWIDSSLPSELKASLLAWCCDTAEASQHELLTELLGADKPITPLSLVPLTADTLLRILPHTLVSRRCEAAALLAATAHLLASSQAADSTRRARVLQLLLTLLKKPDPAETRIITDAVCLIVKWGGSGEVLSCIAELLASRSTERRILASHICVSIAPYVPVDLCTSLLLSLIIVMCESSETEIRQLGLKAAILVCPVAEHKYGQLESLLFAMLKDPVEQIRKDCVCVFAPVLARSALGAGKYCTDLCHRVTAQLSKYSNENDWKNIALYLDVLRALAPCSLAHVVNVQLVKDNAREENTSREVSLDSAEFFLDLQCYLTDYTLEPKVLVESMNRLVNETPQVRWTELEWFLDKVINQLLEAALTCKLLNNSPTYHLFINTLNTYCELFGEHFTTTLIKPLLTTKTTELERRLEQLEPVSPGTLVSVGLCLAAVLPCSDDSETEITSFLKRWVVGSGVCGLPLQVVADPLKWLATRRPPLLAHCLYCLAQIVSSSREGAQGAAVRTFVAAVICELASCPNVPETSIDTHLVPTVIALLHDDDSGVREGAVSALGSVTRASIVRSLPCAERCWSSLEAVVERAGEGAGQAARAADALAALLAPHVAINANSELPLKVLCLLCRVCERAPLTGDVLSSLIPALQLAVHFAQPHETFLQTTLHPALRRLEKMDSPSLVQHKQAADTLLTSLALRSRAADLPARPSAGHLLAGPEAVGRRVTHIFQQSKNNMNIPNIFKKKS